MSRSKKIAVLVAVICIIIGLIVAFAAIMLIKFDFSKLNTMNFETKTYEVNEDFNNINIQNIKGDIYFLPATDGQCKVVCKESDKTVDTVDVSSDTLTITQTDTRRWYEYIGIMWWEDLSVTVYLPEQEYQALYIKSISSDIEVPDNFSFSKAELLSTSGNITFTGTTKESLSIESTSGNIRAKNTTNGTVNFASTSGSVYLSEMSANNLNVKTTSGKIELATVTIHNDAKFEATSGDIKMENSDAESFEIETVSGNVRGRILSPKNFVTKTTSGNVSVPDSYLTGGSCKITTTSGNISIEVIE